jgi:hypothetical protein
MRRLDAAEERLHALHQQEQAICGGKERRQEIEAAIREADPLYIDTHLETLSFLELEVKRLKAASLRGETTEDEERRLHHLERNNRLFFAEEAIRQATAILEVEERQQQPIEADLSDVRKLLCLIEGTPISPLVPPTGRPQLLFKEFQLQRKPSSESGEVFEITMQLIKREHSR